MATDDSHEIQWISYNDFSAGIRQRTNFEGGTISPSFQRGAATIENTYRCISLPSGGLGPLPGRRGQFVLNPRDTLANVVGQKFAISGIFCQPAVVGTPLGGGYDFANLFVAFEWNNQSTSRRRWQMCRLQLWSSTTSPTINLLEDITDTDYSAAGAVRATFINALRASSVSATTPGVPAVVYTWFAGSGNTTKRWTIFPNPGATTSATPQNISTTLDAEPSQSHQGRSVVFDGAVFSNGSASISSSTNENVFYTNSNLTTIQNGTADVWGSESAQGIGAVISMNAQELFVVKSQQGGYMIRGDIADPTVYRLPGVAGTGASTQMAVSSPIGAVYASLRGGVWLWNGGDVSQCISDQMDPAFLSDGVVQTFNGYHFGRFECLLDYVFAPNNYVWDYKNGSWWRLEDPDDVRLIQYSKSFIPTGLFASPATYTDMTTPYVYFYDWTYPAPSYSWQSQPQPESMDTIIDVRYIVLVGAGSGTVTVTFTGKGGVESVPVEFTFNDDDNPKTRRGDIGITGGGAFQATHVQVRIESDSGTTTGAPIVYELRVGYRSRTGIQGNDT